MVQKSLADEARNIMGSIARVLNDRELAHDFYLLGYGGTVLPRWCRRLLHGTILHHGWLCGYMAIYWDDHSRSSVTTRDDFRPRKGVPGQAWPFVRLLVGHNEQLAK